MKSVLLIGMGKFGCILGEKLIGMGDEVVAVDKNEEIIDTVAPLYTDARIMNCMVLDHLKTLDVSAFDVCVVSIAEDFQASLEITSNLKDLGAKRVVARASTEIQRKFLVRAGADEVVYPDQDVAEKLAIRMNSENVINYIDLDAEYSIFEIELPPKWLKRRLADINPRAKYGMNLLMVKRGEEVIANLDGEFVFEAEDQLVVFGNAEKILAFANKKGKK